MKLWLISATAFFCLFIVFFARQLPKHNWWFSTWLLSGTVLQLGLAVLMGARVRLRLPVSTLDVLGWLLIGAALIAAHRRGGETNGIIWNGLLAVVLLQLVALAGVHVHSLPERARALVSNLAGLAPTLYMLAAFSGLRFDRLPVWIADFRLPIFDWKGAVGWARALLG